MARQTTPTRRTDAGNAPARISKTYAASGVSIDEGDALVDYLKKSNPLIGGFSGLAEIPRGFKNPRLVMSTDGVGTKLLVAQLAGRHDSIGIDLVAMVVNDLIVCGARPLWFLDYFATGRLEGGVARQVLKGIMTGCRQAGCALVGGETAEMPGMYAPGHYDLAGFGVGVVDARRVIDGRAVKPGHVLLGLGSAGLHSNGYSLARNVLFPKGDAAARKRLAEPFGRSTLGQELLAPTKIYVPVVMDLLQRFPISSMAHITGGGIEGNLVRVLPKGVFACVELGTWPVPPIFDLIARKGPVAPDEMFRVFNMGVGLIMAVPANAADGVMKRCKTLRQPCYKIGWIEAASKPASDPQVFLLEPEGDK